MLKLKQSEAFVVTKKLKNSKNKKNYSVHFIVSKNQAIEKINSAIKIFINQKNTTFFKDNFLFLILEIYKFRGNFRRKISPD